MASSIKFGSDEFEFTEDELGKPATLFVSRRFRASCDLISFLNIRYLIQRSYLASYNMCNRVPTDPGYEIVPRAPRSAGGPGGRQGIFSMYIIMMYMLESCCIYWNLDIYITNLDTYIQKDFNVSIVTLLP